MIIDHEYLKRYMLEAAYRVHKNEVYKICLHYLKDEHVAQDITQRTFLSFYKYYDNVRPGKTRAYLFRAARNMSMNWLRDFKRLKEGWIEDINEEDLKDFSAEEIFIRREEERLAKELSDTILAGLFQKNRKWHELVVMAYYFDIPQDEIAKMMDVKVDSIYSKLYRAKQWIRVTYAEDYEKYLKMKKE